MSRAPRGVLADPRGTSSGRFVRASLRRRLLRPRRHVACVVSPPMMRVTRIVAGEGGETLRVEGRLTHETVEELRMACEPVLAERRSLRLDVAGLKFVDATGVTLLHGLEQR